MSIRVCAHCGRITGVRECPWCGHDTFSGVEAKHRPTIKRRKAPVTIEALAASYGVRVKVLRRWLRQFANEVLPETPQVQQLSYAANKPAKASLMGRLKSVLKSMLPRRLQHAA